jgi:hypothetical protein
VIGDAGPTVFRYDQLNSLSEGQIFWCKGRVEGIETYQGVV